ncbi:putative peptidase C14 [Rosellinia necatrix]|uniref:Protein SERAC1 n=1 Tax=Rosellinia necatrix TaxID=77044 RepID=A0A1W2TW99_ROSNE|nr:putative peptidase C14 [Rosellinia necatrix]
MLATRAIWAISGLLEGTSASAAVCATAVCASLFLYSLSLRIYRRDQQLRPDGIKIISDPANAEFEIVTVHGLGAHPDYTWTCKATCKPPTAGNDRIDLRELLRKNFDKARVLSFAHNSDWLVNAPTKTAQEIGARLLYKLRDNRKQRLPIIFIGHSFGGIIIKEALCISAESENIVHDTAGIVFLGTPHQGSPLSIFGWIVARATALLGSSTGLLFTLRHHSSQLSDLDSRFDAVRARFRDAKIYSIYETKPSYILGWVSLGIIVNRNSAKGPAHKAFPVDTDHSGLNKGPDSESDPFKTIAKTITMVRNRASPLKVGDSQIRAVHEGKLNIERLSGQVLDMNQCYINLSIVVSTKSTNEFGRPDFRASLLERLNIKEPDRDLHVNLSNLFEPREFRVGEGKKLPRRILIRGVPGVGKTTLCKKLVHDFIHKKQWNKYFARLLWIPLRNLQGLESRYKLADLLHDEYFRQHQDPGQILEVLSEECEKSATLFLLDGLDEAWPPQSRHTSGILQQLLNQPNIIVTSRPSVQLPEDFKPFDFELETIGFYPNQVRQYVEHVTTAEKSQQIMGFLDQNPLVRDLVRIPIQLDALCFAWDDKSVEPPQTMTNLYEAIERALLNKDARNLKPTTSNHLPYPTLRFLLKDEADLLEKLAFVGMLNGLVIFDEKFFTKWPQHFIMPLEKTFDKTLENLSFIRASPSAHDGSRHYYFLHLTLQEYFAARYLTRMWIAKEDFQLPYAKKEKVEKISAAKFFSRFKYLEQFNIVWRFMAGLTVSNANYQKRFVQVIQEPPLDLLGSVHHRLLMHCLFELPSSCKLREPLEDRLIAWSTFEYGVCPPAYQLRTQRFIASEIEFPASLLYKLLQKNGDYRKIRILKSMQSRRMVSNDIVQLIVSWFRDSPNQDILNAILSCLETLWKHLLLSGQLVSTENIPSQGHTGDSNTATSVHKGPSKLAEEMMQAIEYRLENDANSSFRKGLVYFLRDKTDIPGVPQAIVARLRDGNHGVQEAAMQSLRNSLHLQYVLNHVAKKLDDPIPRFREIAVASLRDRLELHEIRTKVIDMLGDKSFSVQEAVVESLRDNLDLPEIRAKVEAKLTGKNPDAQLAAVGVLRKHLDQPVVTKAIIANLNNPDMTIQHTTINNLRGQPHLPKAIVEKLLARLVGSGSGIREGILKILKNHLDQPEICQAIAACLADEDDDIHRVTTEALREQPNLPETILKVFVARLEHNSQRPDSNWLESPWRIIANIFRYQNLPGTISQQLVKKLENEDSHIQCVAMRMLQLQSNLPKELVGELAKKRERTEPEIRDVITMTLWNQSDLPDDVLQALITGLKDNDSSFVQFVMDTCMRLQSKEILHVCFYHDRELRLNEVTIKLIQRYLHLPEIRENVVAKLGHENEWVRLFAANILSSQPTQPVLDAMVERLKVQKENPYVRHSVVEALSKQPERYQELEEATVQAVILWTDDLNFSQDAVKILRWQRALSDSALASLSSIFKRVEPSYWYRRSAELLSLLQSLPKLMGAISNADDNLKPLAEFLFEQSVERHLAWYHYNGKFHLVVDRTVIEYEGQHPGRVINEVFPGQPDYGQKPDESRGHSSDNTLSVLNEVVRNRSETQ